MTKLIEIPSDILVFIINYFDNETINLFAQTCKQLFKYKKDFYTYNLNENTTIKFCNEESFRNNFTNLKYINMLIDNYSFKNFSIFKYVSKIAFYNLNFICDDIDTLINLKHLRIINCTNIPKLNKLKNINFNILHIESCNDIIKLNLNEICKNTLTVYDCENLVEIKLPKISDVIFLTKCYKLMNIENYINTDLLIMYDLKKITKLNFINSILLEITIDNNIDLKEVNIIGCTNLTHLNLINCQNITHVNIEKTNNITDINFAHCFGITNINSLLSNQKNLKSACLLGCKIMNVDGLEHILRLNLSYCIITNVDKLINTLYLDLTGCYSITNISALIDINIKNINLINCETIINTNPKYKIKTLEIKKCYGLKQYKNLSIEEKCDFKQLVFMLIVNEI